jgi:hypothetical protein
LAKLQVFESAFNTSSFAISVASGTSPHFRLKATVADDSPGRREEDFQPFVRTEWVVCKSEVGCGPIAKWSNQMGSNSGAEEERIHALKIAIRKRFPTTPTPADEDIAAHDCRECLAIRAAFIRRTWDSLQQSELEARFDSLPMLSPSAFKYYLPAYLAYSLEHLDPSCLVCQFTIYAMAPYDDAEEAKFLDWWRKRLPLFTPEQLGVLVQVLELTRQNEAFCKFIPSLEHSSERPQRHYANSVNKH